MMKNIRTLVLTAVLPNLFVGSIGTPAFAHIAPTAISTQPALIKPLTASTVTDLA